MVDREGAERAVKDANPIIDGRKANVNLAYLGAKPRSNNTSNGMNLIKSMRDVIHSCQPVCLACLSLMSVHMSVSQD